MDGPLKILIADPLHPAFKEAAEKLGYLVDDCPTFTKEQTVAVLANYHVLAVRTKFPIDKDVIDAGVNLRIIARAGAGTDTIEVDYARSKGITCIHAAEGNRDAVGEHAIGLLLSLMNNFNTADKAVRNGRWEREIHRGHELKGLTVAIMGYGNMGKSFAQKLQGFEVDVIAYDKYKTGFSDQWAREVSMEEVVRQADVLSLHLPLTPETRKLVTKEFLFHFRKPIWFLNTARGEIADTNAVLDGVIEKKILGAALDVLETEKFPALAQEAWFEKLTGTANVIVTPHVAGWTVESYRKISEVLAQKLKDLTTAP